MTETPFLSVFAAASTGTKRVSAKHGGTPIALVSVAMDVRVAISALNDVAYGSGRPALKPAGTYIVDAGWDDWHALNLSPRGKLTSTQSAFRDGTIGVPSLTTSIAAFARNLSALLLPRGLTTAGEPGSRKTEARYALLDGGRRETGVHRIDDLYFFDAQADADWLLALVEEALEATDDAIRPHPTRSRRPRSGA